MTNGTGNVGIGTASPGAELDVVGDINTTGKLQEGGNDLIPAGFIGMYGAAAAPSGWYLCEGGAISRTTYAALFSAIGTTYGTGNGSTTFNVPDFRDRAPYGASTYTLGSKTTNEINGSAQAATASGGPTSHTVTTAATNSTTDKDVTSAITAVTGVSAHAAHSHVVTYPATAVKFIIKT
jgi:microcystin-dependent protein